ncbi:MAG: hypothetical protein QM619_00470 [Micropruina sp.]|uniref:hypothetical protein n=1 Tax=Micropruina sp. TaxID=2737536 RepID=UPI0039E5CE18
MSTISTVSRIVVSTAVVGATVLAAPGTAHAVVPASAISASRSMRWLAPARGTIAVELDGSTLTADPFGRRACRLRVDATLRLSGTITGTASGVTTAIIGAPCEQVLATPPGTFADVFQFVGTFDGTVLGTKATARTLYAGVTEPGGAVSAGLALRGTASASALVKAQAGGTGSYRGTASAPR